MVAAYTKTDTILKVENVSLTLGENLILRDINISIEDIIRPGIQQGQVVALLGPSGIGKTQLQRILAGLIKPTTGAVCIGNPLKQVEVGQVGLVQQNYPLFDHLTVLNNLSFVNKKYTPKEAKDKAEEYLNYFNLWERRDLYPAQLSGGQRQRVAIIQQLLSSDHFILLDEPFSGLDINMIQKVSDTILKISCLDELNTIFIVSHDISSTCAISDTVLVMGKDQNADGTYIPGAKIKYEYDLIERGLAWDPGIRDLSNFTDLTKEIRANFKTLG